MKKIVLSIATVGLSVIPAVSAHAMSYNPNTNISASQNQSNYVDASKSNSNNSSNVAYYNQTVNYEALSYVKYASSTTAYTNDTQNSMNTASLVDNYMNNNQSQFSMPAMMSQYGN